MPTVPNTDYNNSHASKAAAQAAAPQVPDEERVVEKIVQGSVTVKKMPIHKRIIKSLFGAEDAAGVVNYILVDVVVPGVKTLIVQAGTSAIERAFFGENRGFTRPGTFNTGPITNYSNISTRAMNPQQPQPTVQPQQEFTQVVLSNRIDAENVLAHMKMALAQYHMVTLAELYGVVGHEVNFQDRKWGWEGPAALNGSRVVPVGNGFFLDMPAPTYIR